MAVSCTIRIGPQLRRELDAYLDFGVVAHHQKLDADEAATVMLWNFLETDEEFVRWKRQRRAVRQAYGDGEEFGT